MTISQIRKAPIVASSWLSWMSILITCTEAFSVGSLFVISENYNNHTYYMPNQIKHNALQYKINNL